MTRLNFPYFMNETAIKYIIEAVKMVAREGWKLLPQVCTATMTLCVFHLYRYKVMTPLLTAPT